MKTGQQIPDSGWRSDDIARGIWTGPDDTKRVYSAGLRLRFPDADIWLYFASA